MNSLSASFDEIDCKNKEICELKVSIFEKKKSDRVFSNETIRNGSFSRRFKCLHEEDCNKKCQAGAGQSHGEELRVGPECCKSYGTALTSLWGSRTLERLREFVRVGDITNLNIKYMAKNIDLVRIYDQNIDMDVRDIFEIIIGNCPFDSLLFYLYWGGVLQVNIADSGAKIKNGPIKEGCSGSLGIK